MALLGLLYLAGVHKARRLNLEDLWASDGTGIEIFRATMPLKDLDYSCGAFGLMTKILEQ